MTSRAYTRAYTTPFDTLSLLGSVPSNPAYGSRAGAPDKLGPARPL